MDSTVVQLEFGVQMTCQSCENVVKKALTGVQGIKSLNVDLATEKVVVETSLPVHKIQELIEKTGRKAVVLGSGKSLHGFGAAVAMMYGCGSQGVARIIHSDSDNCVIDGTVDGLAPGKYQLQVHQYGDISNGCESCGDVYTKSLVNSKKKDGDLGIVEANELGRTEFRIETGSLKVSDIIGRSMVLHNLAKQQKSDSQRIACGIIARSSGLFENSKRICACDGVTLWDERNVPIAGEKRQEFNKNGKL